MFSRDGVPEGQLTKTVYEWIRDERYEAAIRVLQNELQMHPNSRAFLSLSAYCHYSMEDFDAAAQIYERLMRLSPKNQDYKLFYAQSLYRAGGEVTEVLSVTEAIHETQEGCQQLKLAIAYEVDDLDLFRSILHRRSPEKPQTSIHHGCLLFRDGKYEEARQEFMTAIETMGFQADLAYNCALCSYKLREMGPALEYLAAIVEQGSDILEHSSEGGTQQRIGLKNSLLIEALNLKIAIELHLRNTDNARGILQDIPLKDDSDLDPVSLYHSAILHWQDEPETAIHKLEHLIENPPFPSEAVESILLLYCRPEVGLYHAAAEFVAKHPDLMEQHLQTDVRMYIQGMALKESSPVECLSKLQALGDEHSANIRRLSNKSLDDDDSREKRQALKTEMDKYLSVLTTMAGVHYDRGRYGAAENLFVHSADICGDHPVWRTGVAHTFFVQGNKYQEAIEYYDDIVRQNDRLLDVTPVILANLCASYIMTHRVLHLLGFQKACREINLQTDLAEDLMRRVEAEEGDGSEEHPLHLCIINLVIGTLYCSKGNFDFGISRVMKSFDPVETKLDAETWRYAKKSFLAVLDQMAKDMTELSDERLAQIVDFLDLIELHGAERDSDVRRPDGTDGKIAAEALSIKTTFLDIMESKQTPNLGINNRR